MRYHLLWFGGGLLVGAIVVYLLIRAAVMGAIGRGLNW